MPRSYTVYTTGGTFRLMALSPAEAITTALELAGDGTRVIRVVPEGEW